ncbi:hypothetical protein [Hyphomonas sp.]|uniref:hypothetical protein n=1 Tax=Hyphomonas sp. TaxID=87 RepID=UPI0030F99BD3
MSAINFTIEGPKSSAGNTPKADVPFDEVSHWIDVTPSQRVVVLNPVIDTIALTVTAQSALKYLTPSVALADTQATSATYWNGIFNRVAEEASDPTQELIHWSKRRIPKYKKTVDLLIPGQDATALLSVDPTQKSMAPLRLEFSVSKLGKTGIKELANRWSEIDIDNVAFQALWLDARITRVDIAVDILNLDISDLVVFNPAVWKIWSAASASTGMQTHQFYLKKANKKSPFLDPKSRSDLLVYDKREEQLAHGNEPRFDQIAHVRVEASRQSKSFLRNLPKLTYPFQGWEFQRPASLPPPYEAWIWKLFFDSARVRGYEAAKMLVPEHIWEKGDHLLDKFYEGDLINEQSIWPDWDKTLQKSSIRQILDWSKSDLHDLLPGQKGTLYFTSP